MNRVEEGVTAEKLLTEPTELRFQASGMGFSAFAWGPEDGPLALCLHGYPDTAWTWRHLGPHLAGEGWRVVAPFMRGYAPTDLAPDGGYQLGALVQDAVEIHDAVGGDERAVLIGHDWGAVAAYMVGAWRPWTFRRIVTMAVPPMPVFMEPLLRPSRLIPGLPNLARQLRCSWYIGFQQLPGISERVLPRVIEKLWADWSPGYDAREDLGYLADSLRGPGRRTAALRYYRAFVQPWYRKSAYADPQSVMLRNPGPPVLYLQGRNDGCLIPAHAERTIERKDEVLAPGSEVEIVPSVGHFMQLEAPELINPRIAAFIEGAR
jgi:pimeloyl-ACP methyl ester carboxylesterase